MNAMIHANRKVAVAETFGDDHAGERDRAGRLHDLEFGPRKMGERGGRGHRHFFVTKRAMLGLVAPLFGNRAQQALIDLLVADLG